MPLMAVDVPLMAVDVTFASCRSSLRRCTEYWKQRVDLKEGRWC